MKFKIILVCSLLLVGAIYFLQREKEPEEISFHHLHPLFSTAHWGIYVKDGKTKETLYAYNENQLFIPASVTKLVTTSKALELLAPSFTFQTLVTSSALPDREGIVHGNLSIVGGAEPFFELSDLKKLAHGVKKRGVKAIEGKILIDDSLLDGTFLPIHTEWEDLTLEYAAENNALSLNGNCLKVTITPHARPQELAHIAMDQEIPYCTMTNQVMTQEKGSPILFSRGLSDNHLVIEGAIPLKSKPLEENIAIHSPQLYVKAVFEKALQELGIAIHGEEVQESEPQKYEMAHHQSEPLLAILTKMNEQSDNLGGNLIFHYLKKRHGLDLKDLIIYDGSGLSRHNLLSPVQIVNLLESSMHKEFIETLPDESVFGCQIHAKSGGMSGISNLAGYIEMPHDRQLLFAIMINCSSYSRKETKAALDTLLAFIIQHYNAKS